MRFRCFVSHELRGLDHEVPLQLGKGFPATSFGCGPNPTTFALDRLERVSLSQVLLGQKFEERTTDGKDLPDTALSHFVTRHPQLLAGFLGSLSITFRNLDAERTPGRVRFVDAPPWEEPLAYSISHPTCGRSHVEIHESLSVRPAQVQNRFPCDDPGPQQDALYLRAVGLKRGCLPAIGLQKRSSMGEVICCRNMGSENL